MSVEAMKQALEALEDATKHIWLGDKKGVEANIRANYAYESLRQAIAEAEKQDSNPVKDEWQLSVADGHSGYGVYAHMDEYPEGGAVLLPFGYFKYALHFDAWVQNRDSNEGVAFYTHPPKREWVGLTDDEVSKIIDDVIGFNSCWGPETEFARAIEAKLKEKNT